MSIEHVAVAVVGGLIGIVLRDHDRRMARMETRQDLGDSAMQKLSEAVVKLTVQVEALQKALESRPVTGSFAALQAESTGQHKALR